VGPAGFIALVSYTGGPPLPRLLTRIEGDSDCHEVLPIPAIDSVPSGADPKIPVIHKVGAIQ
jgi:hypothetical protein